MRKKAKLTPGYLACKNYEKLYDLIQQYQIVCHIRKNDELIVCQSNDEFNEKHIVIRDAQNVYIDASNKEEFFYQCKYYKLIYIEPNK
ncbi:MAG: hypothetical protein ACPGUI_00460 [Halarcobacter sp.]